VEEDKKEIWCTERRCQTSPM